MENKYLGRAIGQEEETEVIMTGESAIEGYKKLMKMAENAEQAKRTNFEAITESPETDLETHRENLLQMEQIQFNEIGFYKYKASKEVDPRWKDAFLEQAKRAEGFARALQCAISILCEKIDGEVQNEKILHRMF